jgi:diaminohydroxyphosphoribosylaminopyrimidine deaminase/5-amino-6-(5-phosphoribosylamino)uracil reductase
LHGVLNELYRRTVTSVLVEGGAATLNAFISADLWDEARVITGQNEFTNGLAAPTLAHFPVTESSYAGDRISLDRRT